MKEVAEKLLEVMRLALEKKKSGVAGNFQGVLNQNRQTFDTTFKLWAGRHPELLPLIAEAQRLQMEGARIAAGRSKPVTSTAQGRSVAVNVAEAFELQKKRANFHTSAAVNDPAKPTGKPKVEKPVPPTEPIPAPEVSAADLPNIEAETVRFLLDLSPAKFRDHFGGPEGLAAFARETFKIEFDLNSDDYAKMVRVLKQELSRLLPE